MRSLPVLLILTAVFAFKAQAQYPPFTKWYQNPLGLKPVNLHTVNGIIIPSVAAAAILLITKKDTTLSKRLSFYTDVAISYGYNPSYTTVYQNNIGIIYPLRKYMAFGAEITTKHVYDNLNNTWGFGVRPFFRFYPLHRDRLKIYFQSGAGLIYFLNEFPQPTGFFGDYRMGTKLNGSPKYGIGADIKINQHLSATVGIWHIHISNGNNPSYERNPGHDSNGFSIGLQWQ